MPPTEVFGKIGRRRPAPWADESRLYAEPPRRPTADPVADLLATDPFLSGRRYSRLDTFTGETANQRARYRSHLADPYVKASVLHKVWGTAQLDPTFVPENPDDEQERQVADFHRFNLNQADGKLLGVVEALMFGPVIEGNGIAHRKRRQDPHDRGKWAGKLVLERLVPKDPDHWEPVTDRYRNWTGIRAKHPDKDKGEPEYVPLDEFVVVKHLSIYDLPEGMSDLRAADRAATCLDALLKLRMICLGNFSGPFLVAEEVPDSLKRQIGDQLTEARGGGGWATLPPGVQLKLLNLAGGNEGDYQSACTFFREEIATAVSGAYLNMMAGAPGAERGSSLEAAGITDSRVWYMAQLVANAYRQSVVPYFTDANFAGLVPYPDFLITGQNPDWNAKQLNLGSLLRANGVATSKKDWHRHSGGWSPPAGPDDEVPGLATPPPGPGLGGLAFAEPPDPTPAPAAPAKGGPQPAKSGDVALAGPDGAAARDLLEGAKRQGMAALGKPSAGR